MVVNGIQVIADPRLSREEINQFITEEQQLWHSRNKQLLPHHPIDRFFTTLAEDFGERAVAVVLSGFGSDGSEGVMRIIPNFDTMNSQQLQQTLGRLGHYRDSRAAQNTQVNALRATKKNPWVTHTPPARRTTPSSGGYNSPFRPSFERPFENLDLNSSRNGTTDPMKWMLLGF